MRKLFGLAVLALMGCQKSAAERAQEAGVEGLTAWYDGHQADSLTAAIKHMKRGASRDRAEALRDSFAREQSIHELMRKDAEK